MSKRTVIAIKYPQAVLTGIIVANGIWSRGGMPGWLKAPYGFCAAVSVAGTLFSMTVDIRCSR